MRIANAVFFFISGFGYSAWASRIPTVKHNLHLSEAGLGTVLFALPIGLMLTMPLTNYLLSKYSGKGVLLFGALFFNVMLCFAGFAAAPWQIAIIMFGFGSSRNIFNISANAQAVGVQQLYTKSIMTTFHGIWSLAGFAGAGLGYIMVDHNIAVRWHLPAVGIAMIVLSLAFYRYALYAPPVKTTERKPIFALPDKYLLKFSFITFASMACENTMYDWSGVYFLKAVHSTRQMAVAAFVFYMVAMTLSRFAGDALVNRIGIKKILGCSGLLITAGLFIAVLFPYNIPAVLGFILVGFGVSCVVPLVFSLAGKSPTMSGARALASISTVGYLGFLLVPPLVGFVAQIVGIRVSFGIIASLGLVIVWMVSKIDDSGHSVVAPATVKY
ncbi:MFS transporter [Mucilaginibacter ginkgonis]|uniref:MFS transporter n=2 Tax=Mucilaginibacter ginkgonis TaxID=2682091 RepID=A0A6I4HTP5_9SPHI|nr:MFS transporter [Mucilaginibacter ginkgonis]